MIPSIKHLSLGMILVAFASPVFAQGNSRHVVPPLAPVRFVSPRPGPTRLPVAPVIRRVVVPNSSSIIIASNQTSSIAPSDTVLLDGSPVSLDQLLDPSPSFGFDFEHLNAVNPDLGIKALIDPITQQRLALAERLLKETPVQPISFPFFTGQPVIMLEQQPPVIVLQQPPAAAAAAPQETVVNSASSSVETSPAPEPLHDVGTFILVLKDGTKVGAVAFTIQSGCLIYITGDGLRKSIAASELDKPATEQLNDDRGTPVHLAE
ncbi:MAG TPA: hypothetical protein VJN21_15170 [Candidatus Acidoferrales bacterium]|nr:hypothetical protein [Candidatus Acidoferrales bacterium]